MISVLTSFLSHKNSNISNKSNELITFIREKILSEIFEFENVQEEMAKLLQQEQQFYKFDQEFKKELEKDLDQEVETGLNLKRKRTTRETVNNFSRKETSTRKETLSRRTSRQNIEEKDEDIFTSKDGTNDVIINKSNNLNNCPNSSLHNVEQKEYKREAFNLPKTIKKAPSRSSSLIALNKNKLPSLDDGQIRLLFKDFISDDHMDNSHFRFKLQNGIYGHEFYQNVYNKYNGLSESLANKRKHVCLKLLNILKLIVYL